MLKKYYEKNIIIKYTTYVSNSLIIGTKKSIRYNLISVTIVEENNSITIFKIHEWLF